MFRKIIKSSLFLTTLALMSFTLVACTKSQKPVESIWSADKKQPLPEAIAHFSAQQKEVSLQIKNHMLERYPQTVGTASVEGSFFQKISQTSGEPIYIKANLLNSNLSQFSETVKAMDLEKSDFTQTLKKTQRDLNSAREILSTKVLISTAANRPLPIYSIDYVDRAGTGVYQLHVLPNKVVLSKSRNSCAFDQGHGSVYPQGPKMGGLAEMVLADLLGDGSLNSPALKILPQVSEVAQSTDLVFDYDPHDARFDQVQTYYYINEALTFFKDTLGVSLPFNLEVQTQFGAPEKINAMFYYHGQIRFGTGDGVTYNNIMKDPSIVIHESFHSLVDAVARLPLGEGEGGSLNEAYADFFTSVLLNNPNLGEVAYVPGPFKRTVANNAKVSEKNGGLYHDSLIVSGTLWEIYQALGKDKSLNLALVALEHMGPNGNFSNFTTNLQIGMNSLSDSEKTTVNNILKNRGW